MEGTQPHTPSEGNEEGKERRHFIQQLMDADREAGVHGGQVHTRFPPEPNGYLHIGYAKAICVNFGLAQEYGGTVNLRFDDTNPVKEDTAYVDAIREDIAWLGFEWNGGEHYTSDYFETLFGYAVQLIEAGMAYVDEQTAEEIAQQKGDTHHAGNGESLSRPTRGGKFAGCSKKCVRANTKKAAWCCGPKSTWLTPTCT